MSWILVSDSTGHEMVINMKKERKLRWKKNTNVPLGDIKEEDLPAYYRLDDRKNLEKATDDILEDELRNLDWGVELDTSKTNADIQQSTQAQKLKMAEIEELKQSGVQGKDIIEEILKNNENFELRTDFSKEKYLKKKKAKYDLTFKMEKCTVQTVFRHFQKVSPKDMM
jgi:hypothetical protein